jgi:hypothetical protein
VAIATHLPRRPASAGLVTVWVQVSRPSKRDASPRRLAVLMVVLELFANIVVLAGRGRGVVELDLRAQREGIQLSRGLLLTAGDNAIEDVIRWVPG